MRSNFQVASAEEFRTVVPEVGGSARAVAGFVPVAGEDQRELRVGAPGEEDQTHESVKDRCSRKIPRTHPTGGASRQQPREASFFPGRGGEGWGEADILMYKFPFRRRSYPT